MVLPVVTTCAIRRNANDCISETRVYRRVTHVLRAVPAPLWHQISLAPTSCLLASSPPRQRGPPAAHPGGLTLRTVRIDESTFASSQ